jgi:Rrf2 family protein
MRLSDGVEWGLHSCTVLAILPEGTALPASRLAEFHGVPGAYLAKHLQALSRAGILESVPGQRGGYRLARRAEEITLLDVVEAIEGTAPSFRCTEIRQRGPAAVAKREYRVACGIARAMRKADDAWRDALRDQTILDMVMEMGREVPPAAAVKGAAWFQEVIR